MALLNPILKKGPKDYILVSFYNSNDNDFLRSIAPAD